MNEQLFLFPINDVTLEFQVVVSDIVEGSNIAVTQRKLIFQYLSYEPPYRLPVGKCAVDPRLDGGYVPFTLWALNRSRHEL